MLNTPITNFICIFIMQAYIFYTYYFSILMTLRVKHFKPNEYNFIIMLKEIIISVLLIRLSFPLTSTTFNNCPTQFLVTNYNTTSSSPNQGLADSLYSNLFSSQTQIKIKKSLDSGNLSSLKEQVLSIDFMLPYIVIASIFGLVFILTIFCCTFDKRCPPCESWRRNYLKEPYSKIELRATMVTAIIFSAAILVTTIVVFSSFSTINKDIQMVKCGLFYSLDVALNGDQENNWGGFSRVQSQIQNISGQLGSAASTITTTLTNNQWIKTGMQTIKDMNSALWTDNKDSQILTPNPATTKAAINAQIDIPKIVPYFVQQYLGPNGEPNKMTTDIDSGLQITQKLSDQAYIVYKSSINLANSASSIVVNTDSNLKSISIATSYLSKITTSVQQFQQNFIKIALQKGIYIVQAIFGFILLASLISLIGIISTHLFQLLTCKKIVNGGWVLFGFMYFAILLVLFIFLSVGGLSYSFCQHLGGIITSNAKYNSFITAPNSGQFNKFFEYLDVCFFSDGNILEKFEVSNEMKSVSEVFLNIQKFTNMQTAGNTVYVDTSAAPTKVLSWMNKMNDYSIGTIYDADSTDISENNPHVSLANFNKITNNDSVGVDTVCARDLWSFDSVNCTYGSTQSIFSPSSDMTNGLYFSPTGTICISLNSRISTSAPSIWTASDIAQRYLSVRSCKSNSDIAFTKILDYATSLTNYRDSRINVYKGLSDKLSDIQLTLNEYSSNITDFTTKTSTFFSSASTLNNLVTNQLNGLVISSNCTIIADSVRFFYNMYCINFLYRSIKVVLCCVLLLFFMIVSVIVGGIFATRYSRVEKVIKFKGTDSQSQLFKEDHIQRTESSTSSNSQEQNQ